MARSDMSPAIHNIGLCGLTGVIFAVLTCSLILYLEGFVTTAWSVKDNEHAGLWQKCVNETKHEGGDWLVSVQVLTSLSLVGVVIAFGLAVIYLSANRASKNITIICLAAVTIITGIFMTASVIVYGVNSSADGRLSWSYYATVAATILTFFAAILTIVQIRHSNVRL